MKLQPIHPPTPAFIFRCEVCQQQAHSGSGWAHVEGKPFQSYVCGTCAAIEGGVQERRTFVG